VEASVDLARVGKNQRALAWFLDLAGVPPEEEWFTNPPNQADL